MFSLFPTSVTKINLLGPVIFFSLMLCFFLGRANNARVLHRQIQADLKKLQQTMYAITTQRIVEVSGTSVVSATSYSRKEIGKIDRIETQDGWGDIIYSSPLVLLPAICPQVSLTTGRMVGIPDVRVVQELLLKTFKDT